MTEHSSLHCDDVYVLVVEWKLDAWNTKLLMIATFDKQLPSRTL